MSSQWLSLTDTLTAWIQHLNTRLIETVPELVSSLGLPNALCSAFKDALGHVSINVIPVSQDKQHFQGAFTTSFLLSLSARLVKLANDSSTQSVESVPSLTSLKMASALAQRLIDLNNTHPRLFHFFANDECMPIPSNEAWFPLQLQFAAPGYLNVVFPSPTLNSDPVSNPHNTPAVELTALLRRVATTVAAAMSTRKNPVASKSKKNDTARPIASVAASHTPSSSPTSLCGATRGDAPPCRGFSIATTVCVAITDLTSPSPPPPLPPALALASSSSSPLPTCPSHVTLPTSGRTSLHPPSSFHALSHSSSLPIPPSSPFTPLSTPIFAFSPVAFFHSCFAEKYGTPRQGAVCPHARGALTLVPGLPGDSLEGLEAFSHVWLVFVFHANNSTSQQLRRQGRCGEGGEGEEGGRANEDARVGTVTGTGTGTGMCAEDTLQYLTSGKTRVVPPKLGVRTGCFASRSPHRVNPIGLTLARVAAVCPHTRTLTLSGVDLIDGTPVLDIKPYHPADTLPWGALKAPEWVVNPYIASIATSDDADMRAWAASARAAHARTHTDTDPNTHTYTHTPTPAHLPAHAHTRTHANATIATGTDSPLNSEDRARARAGAGTEVDAEVEAEAEAEAEGECGGSVAEERRHKRPRLATVSAPVTAAVGGPAPPATATTAAAPDAANAPTTAATPNARVAGVSGDPGAGGDNDGSAQVGAEAEATSKVAATTTTTTTNPLSLCSPHCCIRVRTQAREALDAIIHANQVIRNRESGIRISGKHDSVISHPVLRGWDCRSPLLDFYGLPGEDSTPLLLCLAEVLRADPRSVHAIAKGHGRGIFAVRIDGVDFHYFVSSREERVGGVGGEECGDCACVRAYGEGGDSVEAKDSICCDHSRCGGNASSSSGNGSGSGSSGTNSKKKDMHARMFVTVLEVTLAPRQQSNKARAHNRAEMSITYDAVCPSAAEHGIRTQAWLAHMQEKYGIKLD